MNAKDSFNGTGLIRAADRGYVQIVRRLLETEIDVDHVNRLGWTALLEAIILGGGDEAHTEVVRVLVEGGVDVELADGDGVTPLAHARSHGYEEMVAILTDAGAARLVRSRQSRDFTPRNSVFRAPIKGSASRDRNPR